MNRNARTAIVLGVALVAASVAAFAVYQALQRLPGRVVEVRHQPVVVAARPLPIGAQLAAADLIVAEWPADYPVPDSFARSDDVVGRGLVAPLVAHEPVTEGKLAPRTSGAGLPPTIPMGLRAISIKVNEVIGVSWFVRVGMRVDVLATLPDERGEPAVRVVVSYAQVLALGTPFDEERSKREGRAIAPTVVTLAVTPDDAARVALAAANGQLTLTLRNPLDGDATDTPEARLRQVAPAPAAAEAPPRPVVRRAPPPPVPAAEPPPPAPKAYTVEAIRGGKRAEEIIK